MTHKFCTLKEAAQTLHASEDQIKVLLDQGLLREFREGPHRLVKESEVGALALKQRRRREAARRPAPNARSTPGVSSSAPRNPQLSRTVHSHRPRETIAGPSPRRKQREEIHGLPSPALSVRQWFWDGLVQDRPAVILLLSGLILLAASALAAGLCFLVEV